MFLPSEIFNLVLFYLFKAFYNKIINIYNLLSIFLKISVSLLNLFKFFNFITRSKLIDFRRCQKSSSLYFTRLNFINRIKSDNMKNCLIFG